MPRPTLFLPYPDRTLIPIFLAIFLGIFWVPSLRAEQIFSLALGAIEEGDERYRPEWVARYLVNGVFYSDLHYYGRIQGRVRQTTGMLTMAYNYPMLGSKYIAARIGGALSYDEAVIRSSDPELETRHHQAYNLGFYFGIGVQTGTRVCLSFDWNNAQFLAGSSGILLATGRKQDLSLGVGWRL